MPCALLRSDIGVDAENVERDIEFGVAREICSATELIRFDQLSADEKHRALYDIWTLKEAYVKARGFGLSMPMRKFNLDAHPNDAVTIGFTREVNDHSEDWQFFRLRPTARHYVAVCVRRTDTWTLVARQFM